MDVTHIKEFGKHSFAHLCINTYAQLMFPSARTAETVVIQHSFQAFSYMGKHSNMKTDNGPAYPSKAFSTFCEKFTIIHTTGIPYNPQ